MQLLLTSATESRSHHWLLLIMAGGLLLRLIYFQQNIDNPFFYAPSLDEAYYIAHGRFLAETSWLGSTYTFYMDPLYSYFLGASYTLGLNNGLIRLLQVLLDSLSIYLIYRIALSLWLKQAPALLAALIYALYLPAIFFAPILLKTTCNHFMLLVFIAQVLDAIAKNNATRWLVAGVISGLLCYMQGNNLLLVVFLIPTLVLFFRNIRIWSLLIFIIGFSLPVMGGYMRNYVVEHNWRPFSSSFGYVFYIANHPANREFNHLPPAFVTLNRPTNIDIDFRHEAERREHRAFTTPQASQYWTIETLKLFWKNPDLLQRNLWGKCKLFISSYEMPNNYSMALAIEDTPLLRLPLIQWPMIFGLGLAGLFNGCRTHKRTLLCFLPILVTLLTCVLFFPAARYRFPAVGMLIVGSGYSLCWLYTQAINHKFKSLFAGAVAIGLLIYCSYLVPVNKVSLDWGLYNKAVAYLDIAKPEKAGVIFQELLRTAPDNAHYLLGHSDALLAQNQPEAAIEIARKILSQMPGDPTSWHLIGMAYLVMDKPSAAIDALERALEKHDNCVYRVDLARAQDAAGNFAAAKENYELALKDGNLLEDDARYRLVQKRLAEISSAEK